MSDNLKNDIVQAAKVQRQNMHKDNAIKVSVLKQPQKSVFSKQVDLKAPRVLNENAGVESDND